MYSSSSEQQNIVAIYREYGKCEYIQYSASEEVNDMHDYNKKKLNQLVYPQRKHLDLDNI